MDMIRIGSFLKQLRTEKHLTQEQLGEKLGVSGKTVSRWETGVYLPPVEMLQLLSEMHGLTINELLAGQRLTPDQAPAASEETLTELVRENAAFRLAEQKQFWLSKWEKEHRLTFILLLIAFAAAQIVGLVTDRIMVNAISSLLTILAAVLLRNARDSYVEHHLYD